MMIERDETLFAQQQVVRLQALLEAGRQIHSTIELDEVLRIVLRIVVRELELDGAYFTHFPHAYGDVPEHLLTQSDAAPIPATATAFALHDKAGSVFTHLIVLAAPARTLSLDEIDFLESLALQAAVAIENARFHARTVEWQRVEGDLASARNVQRSLLPQRMPEIPNYSLAMRSVTCYEVGGDYLDIVPSLTPGGPTTIVVADVAGKGLASALVTTGFRSAFRAMVNAGLPLLEIATQMNLLHHGEGEESRRRYVTAILLQLDPLNDSMTVVNCGHNPAFLISSGNAGETPIVEKIGASGTPIGLLPFSTYHPRKYALPPGSRLLLYTDGLTEVFRGEEEFGEERLLDCFAGDTATRSDDVIESLWSALDSFSDGQEQSDDMTAMVLLRQG